MADDESRETKLHFDGDVTHAPGIHFPAERAEYQYPAPGTVITSRDEMTEYHNLMRYARDSYRGSNSSGTQKYYCQGDKCTGRITVKYESGKNRPGEVKTRIRCTCAARTIDKGWFDGKPEALDFPTYPRASTRKEQKRKQNPAGDQNNSSVANAMGKKRKKSENDGITAVVGTVLQYINDVHKVKIIRVFPGAFNADKRTNQSDDVANTFLAATGEVFVSRVKKVLKPKAESGGNLWKFVAIKKYKNKNGVWTEETISEQDCRKNELSDDRTCSMCMEEQINQSMYIVNCPEMEVGDINKFCISCLQAAQYGRTRCPVENNFEKFVLLAENYVTKTEEGEGEGQSLLGFRCFKCNTHVEHDSFFEERQFPNGQSIHCNFPYAWIGDRPCKNKKEYEITMRDLYIPLTEPYVNAHFEVTGYKNILLDDKVALKKIVERLEQNSDMWKTVELSLQAIEAIAGVAGPLEKMQDYFKKKAYDDVPWLKGIYEFDKTFKDVPKESLERAKRIVNNEEKEIDAFGQLKEDNLSLYEEGYPWIVICRNYCIRQQNGSGISRDQSFVTQWIQFREKTNREADT